MTATLAHTEKLSAIGLGCMSMSHAYGTPDDAESIKTLHYALDLGINFWDTADFYGDGKNEELIAKVLSNNRNKIFIATKFGFKSGDHGSSFTFDGSPAYVKTAIDASLRRLKVDTIDLYYAHRVDPKIPIEETVGAMAELVKVGKVRYLGLSEASVNSLKKAHAVHPISALQSEYSLLSRDVEKEILPACREMGITFVPFSPLARGLMTNTLQLDQIADNDFRKNLPRYQQKHWENNQALATEFAKLAQKKECSPAELALAWVLAQGENIIPIPGTKKREKLKDNAGSVKVKLSVKDLEEIEDVLARYPDTGARYNEASNSLVDKS